MPISRTDPSMPAQSTANKNLLADLRFLSVLVLITALCSTLTIMHTLHKQAQQQTEQQNTQFRSIIIMIVAAALSIFCANAASNCSCVDCRKNKA